MAVWSPLLQAGSEGPTFIFCTACACCAFLTQADQFIYGVAPSITARSFSACPSDSTSRWTPCPPENCKRRLQVRLGCIRLSPSCPFRLLNTFRFLRPATHYRRFWIRRSSSERRRDLNPPDQRAAQREVNPVDSSELGAGHRPNGSVGGVHDR